jgi:hypothetical protein
MELEIFRTRNSIIPKVKTKSGLVSDINVPEQYRKIEMAIRSYPSRLTHSEMQSEVLKIIKSMPDKIMGRDRIKEYQKADLLKSLKSCLQFNHDISYDGSFIARAESIKDVVRGGFYYFKDLNVFGKCLCSLKPEQRTFHEIVKPNVPRKAAFDIDAKQTEIEKAGLTREIIYNEVVKGIKGGFHSCFGIRLADKNLIVCDSSSEQKFSRHILIDGYHFSDTAQFVVYQERVPRFIDNSVIPFLDMMATKYAFSSLRIIDCYKVSAPDRVKKMHSNHKKSATFIQYTPKTSILLPALPVPAKNESRLQFSDEILNQTMAIVNKTFDMDNVFSVREVNGTIITLDRMESSFCHICHREHENDNMFITINGNKVYARCFGFGHQAHISSNMEEYKLIGILPWEPAIVTAHMLWDEDNVPLNKLIQPLPNSEIYDEEDVRDFDFPTNKTTLLIRSAVGTGKTKALKRYIENENPSKIVIVSFRKAFTEEMKGKLNGFLDYRDVNDEINVALHKKVIVQFESLHRLQCRKSIIEKENGIPDLLVLDEIESIIDQMEHKVMKKNDRLLCNVIMFEHLLKQSKLVIGMDAFLSDRSVDLLSRVRDPDGMFSHDNLRQARKENTFTLTTHNLLYPGINSELSKDHKVVVVSNTKKFAKGIYRQLKEKYGDTKKIKLYTGENSCEPEVQAELNNVNESWKDVDALIYTSTILAGCSFEVKHFDMCFGFFTNNTVTAQGCLQMLGRVRDISSKQYIIAFANGVKDGEKYQDNREFIEQFLCDYYNKVKSKYREKYGTEKSISSLAKQMADFCGNKVIEIGDDGMVDIQIKKDFYYHSHIDNIVTINNNRNYFICLFLRLLKIQGCTLEIDLTEYGKELVDWIEIRGENETLAHAEFCTEIANIENPTKIETEKLVDINGVRSRKEFLQVEKIKFARHYEIEYEDITPEIIMDYGRKNVLRQYLNVKRITIGETVRDSLAILWEKVSSKTMREYNSSTMQVSINHSPEKHNVALSAIEVCGFPIREWKTPFGEYEIHTRDQVEKAMRENLPAYIEKYKRELIYYFKKRPKQMEKPESWDFKRASKFIEGITMFYGVKVQKKSKKWADRDNYIPKMNDMFEWNGTKNKLELYSITHGSPIEKKRSEASKMAEILEGEKDYENFMATLDASLLSQIDLAIQSPSFTEGIDDLGLLTELSRSVSI